MIIILSDVSDPALTTAAQNAHNSNAAAFGTVYAIGNNIPVLGISEDLFILAHGAAVGDQGIPVIGSAASDFYLDAAAFFDNFRSIFPNGYSGDVYVDACYSGDTFTTVQGLLCPSFATSLCSRIRISYRDVNVFGRHGSVSGTMLLPGDPAWVQG